MENREGLIWFDGEFVDWKDANIHILNHGLHYASSVFEGERSYSGKIFKVKEHTERLFESAKALDLRIPYSIEEIIDASYKALELNNLTDAYLRPIVWRGSEMGVSAPNAKVHCAIAVWEWPSYFTPEEILKSQDEITDTRDQEYVDLLMEDYYVHEAVNVLKALKIYKKN